LWAIVYVFFASQSRLFNLQSIKELAAAATALQAQWFEFIKVLCISSTKKNKLIAKLPCCRRLAVK
jgi:hypothetical protein